jgi:hypothetical protein
MANFITNRGRAILLRLAFRNAGVTAGFKLHLVTAAVAPTVDTNTLGQLTEIDTGNGYAVGGIAVARSAGGFDDAAEDDTGDKASIALVDVVLTAAGGPIPASGGAARYAVLTTDEATVADRQVVAVWDAQPALVDGQSYTLQDATVELTTPA